MTTATPRKNVIDGEFFGSGTNPAVLASIAISPVEVETRERDVAVADTCIGGENDDFQWSQTKRRRSDRVFFGEVPGYGDVMPGLQVMYFVGDRIDDGSDIACDQANGEPRR